MLKDNEFEDDEREDDDTDDDDDVFDNFEIYVE